MPFGLNYRDYLSNAPGLNASENAAQPMSEDEWNRLPMDQQWGLLGNGNQGLNVNQFDNRYQGLLGDGISGGDNSNVHVHPGTFGSNTDNRGIQRFNDPSQVQQRDGYYATAGSNGTAASQKEDQWSFARNAALMYAGLAAGGYFAGGLGAGASGADGLLAAAPGEGFGTGAAGAGASGAGASGAAAGSGLDFSPHPYTGQFSGGTGVGSLGPDFVPAGGGGGGFDFSPHEYTGQFGGGSGVGSLGPDFVPSGGGFLDNAGRLAGRAGQWVIDNPIRTLGLVQTASGLIGRNGSSPSGGNGGNTQGKTGNGSAPGGPVPQSGGNPNNFYVNPYTLAQLQRSYQ